MILRFLLRALAAAFGFWVASKLISGVHVAGPESLLVAGLVLGLVNALLRPVLIFLTLPLTILTLGLFLFVVNGLTVWLVTRMVHGVLIDSLWHAVLTAAVVGITSWLAAGLIDGVAPRHEIAGN